MCDGWSQGCTPSPNSDTHRPVESSRMGYFSTTTSVQKKDLHFFSFGVETMFQGDNIGVVHYRHDLQLSVFESTEMLKLKKVARRQEGDKKKDKGTHHRLSCRTFLMATVSPVSITVA
jgi:hypothetical protein